MVTTSQFYSRSMEGNTSSHLVGKIDRIRSVLRSSCRVLCIRWNYVKSRRSQDLRIWNIKLRKIVNSEVKAARQLVLGTVLPKHVGFASPGLLHQEKNSGI